MKTRGVEVLPVGRRERVDWKSSVAPLDIPVSSCRVLTGSGTYSLTLLICYWRDSMVGLSRSFLGLAGRVPFASDPLSPGHRNTGPTGQKPSARPTRNCTWT